jgi:hypothetical protein
VKGPAESAAVWVGRGRLSNGPRWLARPVAALLLAQFTSIGCRAALARSAKTSAPRGWGKSDPGRPRPV